MNVYVVTSKATEKNSTGTILSVKVRCYGCFTSETFAYGIADKVNGTVETVILDQEYSSQDQFVLQSWVNPGYID